MKGFRHQTDMQTVKNLKDDLLSKVLPYGKWTTTNNEEYLFNRDYEPIAGWNLETNKAIPILPSMWVGEIIEEQTVYYYGGGIILPTTLRKCWDILADWSVRMKENRSDTE